MAATFLEQMETDLAVFFNAEEFGRSAIYKPLEGAALNVVAILEGIDLSQAQAFGINPAGVSTITVRASEVAAPKVHDVVTVDGSDWTVSEVIRKENGVWTMMAVSKERLKC